MTHNDQPFGYEYSLIVDNYAKTAGNLLLVRPRVLGSRSSAVLETKEPRKFPVEFPGPSLDSDTFEITLPAGYEVSGNTLKYTRRLEVKELTVPVAQVETLKKFYRIIAGDERNTAVLQPVAH